MPDLTNVQEGQRYLPKQRASRKKEKMIMMMLTTMTITITMVIDDDDDDDDDDEEQEEEEEEEEDDDDDDDDGRKTEFGSRSLWRTLWRCFWEKRWHALAMPKSTIVIGTTLQHQVKRQQSSASMCCQQPSSL